MDVKALIRKGFLIVVMSPYAMAKSWVWPKPSSNADKDGGTKQDVLDKHSLR